MREGDRAVADEQVTERRVLVAGLAAVIAASSPLLLTRYAVPWDAIDGSLLAFRWIGSCLREGSLCEYFPNVFSGYTIAGQPELGFYNALYLLIAFLFPDSVLSINTLYLLLQCAEFLVCFRLGRQLRLDPIGRLALALAVVASGFWVGHAEHFSYLTSSLSATMIFSGLLDLSSGRQRPGFAFVAIGCYMLGSAGYPALMVSIALVSGLLFFHELARAPQRARMAATTLAAVLVGAAAALPALVHFWSSLERSSRLQGLSVAEVMAGSLPPYALANFLLPSWHWPVSASATDVSMDRFHLLHTTPWVLAAILLLRRRQPSSPTGPIASRAAFWAGLSAVLLVLSLGKNFPLPVRQWLAESSVVFRLGRWPGAEYIFFVQLFLAILAAVGVAEMSRRLRLRTRTVALLLVADFLAVMTSTSGLRIQRTSSEIRGTLPRFKVVYEAGEEDLLQKPRECPDISKWSPGHDLAPHGFSWWGYSPLLPADYVSGIKSMTWALCGGPRLWDVARRRPIPYGLVRYTPSFVSIRFDAPEATDLLLWAETADPFWRLSINGRLARFQPGAAGLRYFILPRGTVGSVQAEMVYLGPVTRIWRRPWVPAN